MPAVPKVGDVYRQEFLLDDAEDVGAILETNTVLPPVIYHENPDLTALCKRQCVKTCDFSPIEPGVYENKFYAPATRQRFSRLNIGAILLPVLP